MISLPPALAPWREQLALFPDDLVLGVGPLVQRLAMAIGPMRKAGVSPTGEFDGYAGLDRRGSYERLLTTEWLLAEEQPDEFIRRAAMGEHAFFAISRREPAGNDSCTVLFDAGPDQLGAPRVVQIALLVVFAQRAQAAGVKFEWGILQEPEKPLATEVSHASALRLVHARTAQSATAETLDAWRKRLGPVKSRDDLWIVSGPRAERISGASYVALSEVLEPSARAVHVEVRPAKGQARTATVDLPPADDCVRLVRDPFRVAVAAPVQTNVPADLSAPPFFADKSRIWCRRRDGCWTALHVPDSPRSSVAKASKPVRSNRSFFALGWERRAVILTLGDGRVAIERGLEHVHSWEWLQPPSERPGQAFVFPLSVVLVLLSSGELVKFQPRWQPVVIANHVLAAVRRPAGLAFVVGSRGTVLEPGLALYGNDGNIRKGTKLGDAADLGAFFGPPSTLESSDTGLLAAPLGGETWCVLGLQRLTTISVPPELQVVGLTVARDPNNQQPTPALIGRDRERPGFTLLSPMRDPRRLLTLRHPVLHVTNCTAFPRFAFVTSDGRLLAYTSDGVKLLDVGLGGAS